LRGETAFNPLGGLMPGRFRLVMPTLSELALHEAAARAFEALLLPPAEFALNAEFSGGGGGDIGVSCPTSICRLNT
jgi:hypothetical protein